MTKVNASGHEGTHTASMEMLVSTDWLSQHLDDANLVVLDCSVHTEQTPEGFHNRSGFDDYLAGHIPGAAFADLKGHLCDRSSPIEFAVPTPEAFCAAMGRLGVGDGSRVVLYDAMASAWAARVWWMLRWVGLDRAALLDGGLPAWKAKGRPLATGMESPSPRHLTPHPRPKLIATAKDVRAAIDDPDVQLVDTLTAQCFLGEFAPFGRAGHIPSAINISAMGLG